MGDEWAIYTPVQSSAEEWSGRIVTLRIVHHIVPGMASRENLWHSKAATSTKGAGLAFVAYRVYHSQS